MIKYKVSFFYYTDCRGEEFVLAQTPIEALLLAICKDRNSYQDWCNVEGFYIEIAKA